jgi:tripartite-type tricarboxylate transporter receptor subunit TctC
METNKRRLLIGTASALLGVAALPAFAQGFPSKTVSMVVPFAPGGSADAIARMIAEHLARDWKQTVLVENKPGAGGTIASQHVARSAPDGHTLLLTGVIAHVTAGSLYSGLGYDPVTSFTPVSMVTKAPFVFLVHESLKIDTLAQFVALGRTKPGELTYSSAGNGSPSHLLSEVLAQTVGTKYVHVPYKGNGPATQALLAGDVNFFIGDVTALPHVRSGRLKSLAVTSPRQSALVPGSPTMAEAGVRGFEATSVTAILAAANTPPEIVKAIAGPVARALARDDVVSRIAVQGFEPAPGTPDELGSLLAAEAKRYSQAIRTADIKVQ